MMLAGQNFSTKCICASQLNMAQFLKMCCKWGYNWKIFRLTLRDLYDISIYLFVQFFWGYYWDMTSSCLHKRCRKYSNFDATKKNNFKNMIFVFLLLQRYKPKFYSRNNNWLNRHTITFVINTSKTGKNVFFSRLLLKSTINWYM